MNYIKHLAGFFDKVSTDERLNPTHVSMYVSLFQFWNANRFQNPISISRNELMKVSKISAKATYHKCMKELNEWQYLKYKPSYNPFKGSLVYLFNFNTGEIEKNEPPNLFNSQTGNEQAVIAHHTKIETGLEQAQEPYINISKLYKQNIVNKNKQAKKIILNDSEETAEKLKEKSSEKKEKLCQKKKNVILSDTTEPVILRNEESKPKTVIAKNEAICTLQQVQEYFASQKFHSIEAEKFYNYFQSNGWLVGGRTKMKDWQAAAKNWMINAGKFNSQTLVGQGQSNSPSLKGSRVVTKAKHLHTNQNKNYNEPL